MVKAKKRRSHGCLASILVAALVVGIAYYFATHKENPDKEGTQTTSVTTEARTDVDTTPVVDIETPTYGWYNFLSEKEKEIYSKVCTAMSDGETEFTLTCKNSLEETEVIKRCIRFCAYDHPEFIKYSGSFVFAFSSIKDSPDGEFTATFGTSDFDEEAQSLFEEKLTELVEKAQALPTDFERALFVHDELVKNCEYSSEDTEKESEGYAEAHSPYGCLVNGKAVCEGYAKAFLAAMNRLGIDCLYVAGSGRSESHAWNCVKLGGDWYCVDVTWDDPEKEEKYGNVVRHDYFCLTTEEAERDHTPDGEFSGVPDCTATKYNYHTYYGLVLDPYTRDGAAELFNSGATSVKFTSGEELDKAVEDLFKNAGCYEIDAFAGRRFAYSSEHMIINVYFDD